MLRLLALTGLIGLISACSSTSRTDGEHGFTPLFDGQSLAGWRANENVQTFSVHDGMMVVAGPRSHLFYDGPLANHDFTNFHLKATVMTRPNANSGIYFHTAFQDSGWPAKGYEAQVNNTHRDRKKTGGLYAIQDVIDNSPAIDNDWFEYDVIVQGKRIILKINGETTVDWTQPPDWQPPANMSGRSLSSGTIAIQGHDPGSVVYYKDIRIKPLP